MSEKMWHIFTIYFVRKVIFMRIEQYLYKGKYREQISFLREDNKSQKFELEIAYHQIKGRPLTLWLRTGIFCWENRWYFLLLDHFSSKLHVFRRMCFSQNQTTRFSTVLVLLMAWALWWSRLAFNTVNPLYKEFTIKPE